MNTALDKPTADPPTRRLADQPTSRYNSGVTEAQQPRAEPREIVELRRLKDEQPDLASAVDLQIELLQLQRRVQARVPLPSIRLDSDYLAGLLAAGPLLRFDHLKIDWSDVRFLVRAAAGAMRTHEALEPTDLRKTDIITRDAERLPFVVRAWYEGPGHRSGVCRRKSKGWRRCCSRRCGRS